MIGLLDMTVPSGHATAPSEWNVDAPRYHVEVAMAHYWLDPGRGGGYSAPEVGGLMYGHAHVSQRDRR